MSATGVIAEPAARRVSLVQRLHVVIAYLVLLALSLPIPIFHWKHIDDVIETMRIYVRGTDGKWEAGLMPAIPLMLRWLGELSCWIPVVMLVLFVCSFRSEALQRFKTICILAILECFFTTLYALAALMVIMTLRR